MKSIKIGKHKIEYYDSIDELPISRYHKYNKYLLIDAGIGSSMENIDIHLQKISAFISKDDKKSALGEIQNLRHNVFFIQEELSPRHMAFVALIKRVDGKEISVDSESDVERIVKILGDWDTGSAEKLMEDVKKKVESECLTYFPEFFENSDTKEYYDLLRKNTIAKLKLLTVKDEDEKRSLSKVLEDTTLDLLTFAKPEVFLGKESAEVRIDKNFDAMCVAISQNAHMDPLNFTTLRFYNILETLNKQAKELNKKHKTKK